MGKKRVMLLKINITPKMRGSVLLSSFFLAIYQQATASTHTAPHSAMRHFLLKLCKLELPKLPKLLKCELVQAK